MDQLGLLDLHRSGRRGQGRGRVPGSRVSARNFAAAATAGRVLSSSPTTSSEVGVDDREGAVNLKRDTFVRYAEIRRHGPPITGFLMPRHHQTQLGAAFSCAEEARHADERFWCDQQRYTLRSAQRQSRRDCTKLSIKGSVHAGALASAGARSACVRHAGTAGLPSFSLRRNDRADFARILSLYKRQYLCVCRLSRVTDTPSDTPSLVSGVRGVR